MTIGPEITNPQQDQLPPVELENTIKKCIQCESIEQSASEIYSSANPYLDTPPHSPEAEILNGYQENIVQMDQHIERVEENIHRMDVMTDFLRKYPKGNESFAATMERYSDHAMRELLRKIEHENIHEGDPRKRFVLLFNFYRGRQSLEDDLNRLLEACEPRRAQM